MYNFLVQNFVLEKIDLEDPSNMSFKVDFLEEISFYIFDLHERNHLRFARIVISDHPVYRRSAHFSKFRNAMKEIDVFSLSSALRMILKYLLDEEITFLLNSI